MFPKVDEIIEFEQIDTKGSFPTKSGGVLSVPFALPFHIVKSFFEYDEEELKKVPKDIRGLRYYLVEKLSKGQSGGNSYHRVRREAVFGIKGAVKLMCEDIYENKREFKITPTNGILMPPFILQSYLVLEDESGLASVCNTLYPLPPDPTTSDTFLAEEFRKLQSENKL